MHTLTGQRAAVTQVSFLAKDKLLAVASEDRSVTIWDAQSGRRVRVLAESSSAWPSPMATSRRGLIMATPGLESRLLIWDFGHAQRFATQRRMLARHLATLNGTPDEPTAQAALGSWYALRGKWDWAAELLTAARKGGAVISDLSLARALRSQGKLDEARAALDRAAAASEAPELYLRLLGQALDRDRAVGLPVEGTRAL